MEKKPSDLKLFLIKNGINQSDFSKKSLLSIGTLHKLLNNGDATEKTIKLAVLALKNKYGVDITVDEFIAMM